MAETLELDDIQGLFARGYGSLPAARYLLLEMTRPAAAAGWLGTVAGRLTSGRDRPDEGALNLALTASGLAKLALPADVLNGFSNELVAGMTTPHRQRMLGDTGSSSPSGWAWGAPSTRPVDAVLLLFAAGRSQLDALERTLSPDLDAAGVAVATRLETSNLDGVEHFGFRDGISQPQIEGLAKAGSPGTVRAGEFVLGYPNEYGRYTARPLLDAAADRQGVLPRDPEGSGRADLGKNGSYLVFRQLSQDVRGFWRYLDGVARQAAAASGTGLPGASTSSGGAGALGDAAAGDIGAIRTHLAAKMVGRWPSGAPLTLAPAADDPALTTSNDFDYHHADPSGFGCPVGAHIRRANPRDSLDPSPGTDASLAVNRRHRLLRRGREYGPPLRLEEALSPLDGDAADAERGLHFICLNGSIARQFEFVQSTWLNNPKFDELYADGDPLVAGHQRPGGTFTIEGTPVRRRLTDLPQFVTVRGGAYFFMPGIRAIRYLATLRPA